MPYNNIPSGSGYASGYQPPMMPIPPNPYGQRSYIPHRPAGYAGPSQPSPFPVPAIDPTWDKSNQPNYYNPRNRPRNQREVNKPPRPYQQPLYYSSTAPPRVINIAREAPPDLLRQPASRQDSSGYTGNPNKAYQPPASQSHYQSPDPARYGEATHAATRSHSRASNSSQSQSSQRGESPQGRVPAPSPQQPFRGSRGNNDKQKRSSNEGIKQSANRTRQKSLAELQVEHNEAIRQICRLELLILGKTGSQRYKAACRGVDHLDDEDTGPLFGTLLKTRHGITPNRQLVFAGVRERCEQELDHCEDWKKAYERYESLTEAIEAASKGKGRERSPSLPPTRNQPSTSRGRTPPGPPPRSRSRRQSTSDQYRR